MAHRSVSYLFPTAAIACAGMVGAAANAFGADSPLAVALALSAFAALLAMRSWWIGEEERPLLAEELLGVHDSIDALRAEAGDLRDLLGEMADIVEAEIESDPSIERREVGVGAAAALASLERRLDGIERRFALEAEETRRSGSDQEARMAKMVEALGLLARAVERGAAVRAADDRATSTDSEETRIDAQELLRKRTDDMRRRRAEARAEADRAARRAADAQKATDRAAASLASNGDDGSAAAAAADAPDDAAEPAIDAAPTEPTHGAPRAERIELLIQPVFSLESRELRFFEAYTRERGVDGALGADAAHVARAIERGEIDRVDGVMLARAAALADTLRAGGRDIAVFCNVSLQALRREGFLRKLTGLLSAGSDRASRLILEINQVELDDFSDQDAALLDRLRAQGLELSLDHVRDWSVDIERLVAVGFRYVKLEAAALLARERAAPGAAKRLLNSFKRVGLTLVVEKIETPDQARALERAGAGMGQGRALAAPRLVAVGGPIAPCSTRSTPAEEASVLDDAGVAQGDHSDGSIDADDCDGDVLRGDARGRSERDERGAESRAGASRGAPPPLAELAAAVAPRR